MCPKWGAKKLEKKKKKKKNIYIFFYIDRCLMIIISQFYFNLILSNILNYEISNEYSANMYKCNN